MRMRRKDGRQGWWSWSRKTAYGLPASGMTCWTEDVPAVRLFLDLFELAASTIGINRALGAQACARPWRRVSPLHSVNDCRVE